MCYEKSLLRRDFVKGGIGAAMAVTGFPAFRLPSLSDLRRSSERPYLEAALQAAKWIELSRATTDHGVTWPADPNDANSLGNTLYTHSPGVVTFLLELFHTTGDAAVLSDAMAGADHLADDVGRERNSSAGLYTGLAGLAFVMEETYRASGRDQYRRHAARCLSLIKRNARPAGAGRAWPVGNGDGASREVNDIVSGTAGTALGLLYADRMMPAGPPKRARTRAGMVETVVQDLRYAIRTLRRAPGFTFVAVATLGLAIAGTTAIFSVVNTVLLEPFPFADPDRLVFMWQDDGQIGNPRTSVAPPNYVDWRDRTASFEAMGALAFPWTVTTTGDGTPERLDAGVASAEFFTTMGVPPLMGRTFVAGEDDPGSDGVAVLSHGLWQRRYGGSDEIVGRRIRIDGVEYTVVGVMPPSFKLPGADADLWLPFSFLGRRLGFRFQRFLWVFGRRFSFAVPWHAQTGGPQGHRVLQRIWRFSNALGHRAHGAAFGPCRRRICPVPAAGPTPGKRYRYSQTGFLFRIYQTTRNLE